MVGKIFAVVNKEVRGMHEAAYLLALFALLSQVLALVRDRMFASTFGIGPTLDIYYASFRIPDLLFTLVASLFSLYAILPVLSSAAGSEVRILEKILLWFFGLTGLVAALACFFAPAITAYLAPGFSPAAQEQLVLLTRILLLQPILLGASNILASLTQLRSRFVLYAISPLLYNVGIIVGIVALYPRFGLLGLAWGVVLGALLHALVQVPHFIAERVPGPSPKVPMRAILTLSIPRTLALAAGQITLLVLVAIASGLSAGSISAFTLSMNLQAVPLAVIGMSYSVAAFPTLARLIGRGEQTVFLFHIVTALRHIMFWSIPALVLVVVLRAQIVRVVLGAGAFDWDATRLTAAALAVLIISFAAQSISYLLARGYYAAGKTARPLVLSMLSVAVSIFSALFLLLLFRTHPLFSYFVESLLRVSGVPGTEMLMLALGYSLGTIVQAVCALILFSYDFSISLRPLWRVFLQSFAASVLSGSCAYGALLVAGLFVDINTFIGIFAQGLAGGLVGLSTCALVLYALRSPELNEVIDAIKRRFRDPKIIEVVAIEPSELSS